MLSNGGYMWQRLYFTFNHRQWLAYMWKNTEINLKLFQCFISHVTTAETEIYLLQPPKKFWSCFKTVITVAYLFGVFPLSYIFQDPCQFSFLPSAFHIFSCALFYIIYDLSLLNFYPNVTALRSGLCYRKSVCHLSVVCNVRAPYSGGLKFSVVFLRDFVP